jgi:hypothetical protein
MLRNDSLVDTVFLFYMRSKGQTAYYIQEIESADLNQTCTFIFTITSKIIKVQFLLKQINTLHITFNNYIIIT